MSKIIAGRFQQQEEVENALEALMKAGFPRSAMTAFYVNPAGQHDAYPLGGDRDNSPGAEHTASGIATGVATGGAVGAAVGAATAPLTGPLGAIAGGAVGAHLGSLVGTLNKLESDGQGKDENPVPVRSAGMLVAIQVGAGMSASSHDSDERRAIDILRSLGAGELEQAEGRIVEGDWQDFDPVAPPQLLDGGQP